MKVKLKSTFAADDGTSGYAGEAVDLPEARARQLIDAGAAEEITEDDGPAAKLARGEAVQAGSFGGTVNPMQASGQSPASPAPVPDPLLPENRKGGEDSEREHKPESDADKTKRVDAEAKAELLSHPGAETATAPSGGADKATMAAKGKRSQ